MQRPYDAEPEEEEFAQKRLTRLIIQREPAPKPNDDSLSYFGGLPRLPPHLQWPLVPRRGEDGPGEGPVAPTFLAQIDLQGLPFWPGRKALPHAGTIYIFCNTQYVDVGDPHCAILYYEGSSSAFAERAPPSNLMRLEGIYDRFQRSWCAESDPEAGVGFKYAMRFEVSPVLTDEEQWREPSDWLAKFAYFGHPFLIASWPHTPASVNTLRSALIATVERAKTSYSGGHWPGYADLAGLVAAFPTCLGEPYEWLSETNRAAFQAAFVELLSRFKQLSEGASRVHGSTPVDLLGETALYCVSKGFAAGAFDETTDGGRLFTAQRQIAEGWKQWSWPHQLLGAGIALHDSVFDHIDDGLLLQIAGVDAALAGSQSDCVLQIWVPRDDLIGGKFDNAVATLECS